MGVGTRKTWQLRYSQVPRVKAESAQIRPVLLRIGAKQNANSGSEKQYSGKQLSGTQSLDPHGALLPGQRGGYVPKGGKWQQGGVPVPPWRAARRADGSGCAVPGLVLTAQQFPAVPDWLPARRQQRQELACPRCSGSGGFSRKAAASD